MIIQCFFVIEKVKETVLDFSQMTVRVSFSCIIKMTQYNMLNVKLSNSKHNKLKSAIKNGTQVTLNLSSNIVGDSNDENNFLHKLLLTNTQVSKFRKAFAKCFII